MSVVTDLFKMYFPEDTEVYLLADKEYKLSGMTIEVIDLFISIGRVLCKDKDGNEVEIFKRYYSYLIYDSDKHDLYDIGYDLREYVMSNLVSGGYGYSVTVDGNVISGENRAELLEKFTEHVMNNTVYKWTPKEDVNE